MKRIGLALWAAASLAGHGTLAAAAVELPRWSAADEPLIKQGAALGGEALFERLLAEGESPDSLPGLERIETTAIEPTAGNPVVLGDALLDPYFAQRPGQFLVDPQHLLSRKEYDDQLAFLNYHAADSAIDLYIYVFEREQEIPGEVRVEELAERLFSNERPAAVVLYFLGAPQRTRVLLSPRLAGAVPVAEQRLTIEKSVQHARDKSHPADQLAAFAVQMSIRLYWMEKVLTPGGDVDGPPIELANKRRAAPQPDGHAGMLARLQGMASTWLWPAAVALIGTGVLWLAGRWRVARGTHRFPEFDQPVRLGGPHAAGVGAVITFASTAVPPTRQREQAPEYLRRS